VSCSTHYITLHHPEDNTSTHSKSCTGQAESWYHKEQDRIKSALNLERACDNYVFGNTSSTTRIVAQAQLVNCCHLLK